MTVMERCPASGQQVDAAFDGRCPDCGTHTSVTDQNIIEPHQAMVQRRHKGGRHRAR